MGYREWHKRTLSMELSQSMQIAVHVFEGITMFHAAAPLAVFGEVTRLGLAPHWETVLWSADGRSVRTAEGPVLENLAGPEAAAAADMVVLPSWFPDLRAPDRQLLEILHAAHERESTVAGLCLGAFPVAASGLLDGRSAVTHWRSVDRLSELAPQVQVQSEALYLDHGDILTSAGTASALDACLHLVRSRLGADAANAVARQLVIAPHRDGGQAQYIERPIPAGGSDDDLQEVLQWVLANLDQPLSVAELAVQANMSTRNFTRRFRERTGATPARWINARRLDEARRLLEITDWSVERIAHTCGYASVVTFRQNFLASYDTTPTSYRRHFTAS